MIRAPMQSSIISEEFYCAPWNLKIQEEKFKSLNEQHQITSSCNHKPFHRAYSVRSSSRKKSFKPRELSPPVPPPLPPGGFTPSCLCITNNNTERTVRSSTNTSRNFFFASKSPLNNRTQRNQSRLNTSLPKIQTAYDQPWDILQTSVINKLHGRSLQKQNYSSSALPLVSSCQYFDDTATIPIDRYFWYHHAMSRRQAENVLESRPSGSFLVRQSESGNQNDYSLSIKTTNGCMHMRISYADGFYILGECSRPFSSVSCMIKYFSHTSVPIRGAVHIKLATPILRWDILSSSLSNEELL